MPCEWCAAEAWFSVSLMSIFKQQQPLGRSNAACLYLGLHIFYENAWWTHTISMRNTWCWDTLFAEEGQLIYKKKFLIRISGALMKINTSESSDFWSFIWAEVLCCYNKSSLNISWWASYVFLNMWLTTLKKYNTEWTNPDKFHAKYLQQEKCDYGKLLDWSRMLSTLSAHCQPWLLFFLSMWYEEFNNISVPRCGPI